MIKEGVMKKIIDKIADVIGWIYGYGLMISLFLGALSFFGYLVAFILGGDAAAEICTFIYKDFYPVLITATSILLLIGIVKMYLKGEVALSASKKKR